MPISSGNITTLNWTNPTIKPSINVQPGTSDNSSSSIELIGQGYPGWAVPLQENLLHILENFASNGSPINPTKGQLWWDTSAYPAGKLYVCTDPSGSPVWREIITYPDIFVNVNEPDPALVGYLWVNPVTFELNLCTKETIISPPTPAEWTKILTFNQIISNIQPSFPRVDGQLWFDTISRVLWSWNSTDNAWIRIGPNKDMDVIGSTEWNDAIFWLNKILSQPTNTLDNLDPFTANNTWGFNQNTPFIQYFSEVSSSEWMRFYDVVLNLSSFLGISNTDLIKQDFHIPGQFNNKYGIPFMLKQWDKILSKIEQFKNGRVTISSVGLQNSNSIISFTGTTDAGTILSVHSPAPSGFPSNEVWTLTAVDSSTFNVEGSVSGSQSDATVDSPYDNGIISFTINSGSNPFNAGDEFEIKVFSNLKTSYTNTWGAGNSGINTKFTFAFNDIHHQRAFFNAGGKLKFSLSFDDLTAGHNLFWSTFLSAIDNIVFNINSSSYGYPVSTVNSNLGYYDLTTTYQTVFYLDARILPSGTVRTVGYQAPFSAGSVVPGSSNIGDGTVGAITILDQNPLSSISETWTLTAIDSTTFGVFGSISGIQSNLTVDSPYSNAFFSTTVSSGGTAFESGDIFTFNVSGVSNYVKIEAKIDSNPNNLIFRVTLNDTTTVATDNVTTGGGLNGVVLQLDMLKAKPDYLNDPEITFPTVTNVGWAP